MLGSPPHTRGIRSRHSRPGRHARFTPAYAGNTVLHLLLLEAFQVHPRIRGEYALAVSESTPSVGSPPHTRGIHLGRGNSRPFRRFTPAYAGNTKAHCRKSSVSRVHPRIRGEYSQGNSEQRTGKGSPPHTRGILCYSISREGAVGFTPAYAGNTNRRGLFKV